MFHLLLQLQLCFLDLRIHDLLQRDLSLRMHVRQVLFGHVLYVRDARLSGLSLRHLLLLEVLLVLRRFHLHPLEGRGREMEGETEGEREGETEGEREGETEGEREGETEGEREREGDRWVRVPVTVRVSG
jgi:hypothetical protein